jgi:hypothetical protein
VLYAQAEQKVTAVAKRKKDSTKDKALLARFKGEYPPTLARVMAGEGTATDAGLNQIAMQIAITSHALGKSEAQMLDACAGLIVKHVSDGSRYNTPAKRRMDNTAREGLTCLYVPYSPLRLRLFFAFMGA